MLHLTYSFCMSMLQSLWQAALLLLLYLITDAAILKKTAPLQKRNFLFLILSFQLILSAITFIFYLVQTDNSISLNVFETAVSGILPAEFMHRIAPWLFSAYSFVISYKIIYAILEWHRFKTKYKIGLLKPVIDLKIFTNNNAAYFGIKRKVQLWFSNTINVPVTFGFLKPVIILPVALVNQISLQQAETIILHELTHIKANDYLLNWFLIITENLFFFNPFIISLCKKIRLEREKNCDCNVIAFEYSPVIYAETLLKAQQVQKLIPNYQLAAVTGKRQLLHRIEYFTNSNNFHHYKNQSLINWLFPSVILGLFFTIIFVQYNFNEISYKKNPIIKNDWATVSNSEFNSNTFGRSLSNFYTEKNRNIKPAAEIQTPIIEKKIKSSGSSIATLYDYAVNFNNKEEIISDKSALAISTPVALTETEGTVQVVIKEEQSGSKNAVVKVYTITFINGEWVLIPEWALAAKEIDLDTLQNKIDTSLLEK